MTAEPEAYFLRTGTARFDATEHVGGAWDPAQQHIAPALGLLVHMVERDRDSRRDDGLAIGRLSYDILGTVPIGAIEVEVGVRRPGRTIELVEATLTHEGRTIVVLRAWLMRPGETCDIANHLIPRIPSPDQLSVWDPSSVWPGGFIATTRVRRALIAPGRGTFWVRTRAHLVDGEAASGLARAAGLFDIANGMTVPVSPEDVAFPNLDLTAHLFAQPSGGWLGFDTTATIGMDGIGLTSSTIHDETGPIGTLAQCLTIRPKHQPPGVR